MELSSDYIIQLQRQVAYSRDEKSYKQLFLYFHPVLLRFAIRFLQSNDTAEDIVSDVMMRVWDMGDRLSRVDYLKTYLFTAVKNACLTYLSSKKNRHLTLDNIDEFGELSVISPEQKFLQTEFMQIIASSIEDMPPKCKMVYILIKEEGFKYKEAAEIIGISPNTVEGHMQTALKKIYEALESYLKIRR